MLVFLLFSLAVAQRPDLLHVDSPVRVVHHHPVRVDTPLRLHAPVRSLYTEEATPIVKSELHEPVYEREVLHPLKRVVVHHPRLVVSRPNIVVKPPRVVVPAPIVRVHPVQMPERRMQIVEKHEPRYHVETKVAAPVYILPKHGPVYAHRRHASPRIPPIVVRPPQVHVRPTPVFVKPAPVYVRPPPVYVKPPPVVVRPSPVYVRPSPIYLKHGPTYVRPSPVEVRPNPIYVRPSPVVVRPSATYIRPAPVVVRPNSVVVRSRPVMVRNGPVSVNFRRPIYSTSDDDLYAARRGYTYARTY